MKNIFKLPLILAAYTVVACVALAFIYNITEPMIAATAANEVKSALTVIYPDATDFEDVTGKVESGTASITFDKAYVARTGEAVSGMVIQAIGPTYSSSTILVGVNMDRTIGSIKFTANTDTPGLGSKTADPAFSGQFSGKSVDDGFAVGSDVQAVSGATISSKGVANILKVAGYRAGEYLAANHGARAGTGSAPVIAELVPMSADEALADIFPQSSFEPLEGAISNTVEKSVLITGSWLVKTDGKVSGVAVQAKGQTYHASTVLVGVNLDRTIAGVRINETTDSKNYGGRMLDPAFYGTFTGKPVDDPYLVKSGESDGDVDSISGATISTMGVANIIKVAGFEGSKHLAEKHGGKAGPAGSVPFQLNVIPEEE